MNNVIKKLLAVSFVICLLFGLVACDDKDVKPSATPETVPSGTASADKPDNPNGTEQPPLTPAPDNTLAPGQTLEPGHTPAGGYTPAPGETLEPGQTPIPGQTFAPNSTGTQSVQTNPPWANPTESSGIPGLPNPTEDDKNVSFIGSTYADKKIFGDFVPGNAHITLVSYPDAEHTAGKLTYYSDVVVDGVNFRNIITITSALNLVDRRMSMETGLGAPGVTHTIALEIHGEPDKVEKAKANNKHVLTDAGFTSAEADDILDGKEFVILKGMNKGILAMIAPLSFGRMSAFINGQRLFFDELEADKFFPESRNVRVYYDSQELVQQVIFINQAGDRKTVDSYLYSDVTGEIGYLASREVYVLNGGQWELESRQDFDEYGRPIATRPTQPTEPQPTVSATATVAPYPPASSNTEYEYYSTGELKSKTVYSGKNKTDWEKTEYDRDGAVLAEYTYSQSKLIRQKLYQYNSDGALIEQTFYDYDKSGKMIGTSIIDIQYYRDGSRKETNRDGSLVIYYDKDDNMVRRITNDSHFSYITDETWEGNVHTETRKKKDGVAYSETVTTSNKYGKPLLITSYNINRTGEKTLNRTTEYTYESNGISVSTMVMKDSTGKVDRKDVFLYNLNGTRAFWYIYDDDKGTLNTKTTYDGYGNETEFYMVIKDGSLVVGYTNVKYQSTDKVFGIKHIETFYDADGVLESEYRYNIDEKKTAFFEYYKNGNTKTASNYFPESGLIYLFTEYNQDGTTKTRTEYEYSNGESGDLVKESIYDGNGNLVEEKNY